MIPRFLVSASICLVLVVGCGKGGSSKLPTIPNPPSTQPPSNPPPIEPPITPPPSPPPEPQWIMGADYRIRNVTVEGGAVYVSGVRGNHPASDAAFAAKLVDGKEEWREEFSSDVNDWVTRGIGMLGGDLYTIRWEDRYGTGVAKIYVTRHDRMTGASIAPWPKLLSEGTVGMDLKVNSHVVFAALSRDVIALQPGGEKVWTSNFGFSGREGIGQLAVKGDDLFLSGSSGRGMFGPHGGLTDLIVARISGPTGALTWGKQWGDASAQEGDAITVTDNAVYVAIRTGFTYEGGRQESQVLKYDLDGNLLPWSVGTGTESIISAMVSDAQGSIYFLFSSTLQKVGPNGSWTTSIPGGQYPLGGIAVDGSTLWIVNDTNKIHRVDAASGAHLIN